MAQASDIKWGSYKAYEGPFYKGTQKYDIPAGPTEAEKILSVITATEGGRWDAYNGYDVCISTSGLIQWCERGQYSVSDMLGKVTEFDRDMLKGVRSLALESGLEFTKNTRGRWRFHFLDERGEVDRQEEQRQMFLLNSSGQKGTWDDESKVYAKKWAAAISTVWEDKKAQEIQGRYTTTRFSGFLLKDAKAVFESAPDTNIANAFKAAYLSFAANNPTWANNSLKKGLPEAGTPWTTDWLIFMLKTLTFNPNVTIYPHRYNAIRPVLERLYTVNLPDFAKELKQWQDDQPHELFIDTLQLQKGLIALGFDLGPWGADGKYGKKTKEALMDFERLDYQTKVVVPPEHQDGMIDQYTAPKLAEVLELRGIEL